MYVDHKVKSEQLFLRNSYMNNQKHSGSSPLRTHHLLTLSLFLSARREVFLQEPHWVLVFPLELNRLPAGSISLMHTMRSIYTSLTAATPATASHRPRLADPFRALHKAPIDSLCSLLKPQQPVSHSHWKKRGLASHSFSFNYRHILKNWEYMSATSHWGAWKVSLMFIRIFISSCLIFTTKTFTFVLKQMWNNRFRLILTFIFVFYWKN